jgi:hypothetical protein
VAIIANARVVVMPENPDQRRSGVMMASHQRAGRPCR